MVVASTHNSGAALLAITREQDWTTALLAATRDRDWTTALLAVTRKLDRTTALLAMIRSLDRTTVLLTKIRGFDPTMALLAVTRKPLCLEPGKVVQPLAEPPWSGLKGPRVFVPDREVVQPPERLQL
ncbi:hypothetical protein ROHU_000069 [Labeo rohita]|uniref:Uncharacterized protein n=1 Tax=Labeo rohita TaxID=84645 RepID=A0A498P7T6_LABRO|nr:hypothetical protein ROHU_000069 [Labeo rohita]